MSSDSDQMLEIAEKYGVTPKKRPIEYFDEQSKTFNEVVEYIASHEVKSEIMIWAPCVCPLVSEEEFAERISLFERIQAHELPGDSIATASLLKEYIFDEKGSANFSVEHHVLSHFAAPKNLWENTANILSLRFASATNTGGTPDTLRNTGANYTALHKIVKTATARMSLF